MRYESEPQGVDDAQLLDAGDRVCLDLLAWERLGDLDALMSSLVTEGLEPYVARTIVVLAPARLCPEAGRRLSELRADAGIEEPHIAARHQGVEQSVSNAVIALEAMLSEHGPPTAPEVTPTPEDGGRARILDGGIEVGAFDVRAGVRVRVEFLDGGFTVTGISLLAPEEALVFESVTSEFIWRR